LAQILLALFLATKALALNSSRQKFIFETVKIERIWKFVFIFAISGASVLRSGNSSYLYFQSSNDYQKCIFSLSNSWATQCKCNAINL